VRSRRLTRWLRGDRRECGRDGRLRREWVRHRPRVSGCCGGRTTEIGCSQSMRLLFASSGYKPAYRLGGPVFSVAATAEALVRRGHSVTVLATNANLDEALDVPVNQPVDVAGVEVWYFRCEEPLKRWLPFVPYLSRSVGYLYAPEMGAQLRRLGPEVDLIHTHLPFVYPTYAAAHAARRFHKPLFYHQRGSFDPGALRFRSFKKRLYLRLIERPIMQRATTLIALTEAEVQSYLALDVTAPSRIVPNGIEADAFRTQADPAFVARWGIPADAPVVLFLGRLHPIKGVHKALEAFLSAQVSCPKALLVMAGPDEWGLEGRLRATTRQAGLGQRVLFPGMVSGEDKLNWLARADIFFRPSEAEGFSMAVLEALASGTTALLSPGCHFPEVEAAGAGRVVSTQPTALAGALSPTPDGATRARAGVAPIWLGARRRSTLGCLS
jgi:glycosyltransferase involved in cell wall biosynthesis